MHNSRYTPPARYRTSLLAMPVLLLGLASTGSMAAEAPTSTTTAEIPAGSCAFADVQNAVAAAKDGQTVVIPAGDCDWADNELVIRTGIELKGAGRDNTKLRRTAILTSPKFLVRFECYGDNTKPVAFSGITLVGAYEPSSEDRGLGLIGGCVDFRVARSAFTNFVFAGVEVRGGERQRGVIYKNNFLNNYHQKVHNLGYGVAVYGNDEWPALAFGSEHAVFVEDNIMYGNRHHIASNSGARYVFRYNTVQADDRTKDFQQIDAHGKTFSKFGTRSFEIYKNTISTNLISGRNFAAIGIRGGEGVIFKNTFNTGIAYPIKLMKEGGACQDKLVYIWETPDSAVSSECATTVGLNREYVLSERPDYKPYQYPHPLAK
ncbi:hypothetical protein E7V67_001600 [[Empedobacter] haloabium]|uniref:Right-handed parallel beta-helix repeat-containing protein n=1 Tax=[Empedobacter] haloabium TaxID=592317 RepID=A0ABZ1UM85_9BURK